MRRALALYSSTVGKKIVMAATGLVLFGFVLAHMAGNLKVFQGPEKFDAYAAFLRELGAPVLAHGQALWIARIVLLVAVGLHFVAAIQLTRASWSARDVGYRKFDNLSLSYASRTMRWGGVIIAAFVVYHLLHLTWGTAHPAFSHESVYRNVVVGFQSWWASAAYVVAMVPLCLHIYHGVWSATQSLGVDDPRVHRWRRPVAVLVAGAVLVGNVSIPVAVLSGVVR